jgi:hypothetical protein
MGWAGRSIALLLALTSAGVLLLGASLDADPRGHSTHERLGLPACGMFRFSGIPCMTCGMTTSFAHLLDGRPLASLVTQPMGTLLCVMTAMLLCAGLYVAATGLPGAVWFRRFPTVRQVMLLLGLALLAWGYKIVAVVGGG